jgi:hypothetical protein
VDLRPELLPPLVSPERLESLCREIRRIENLGWRTQDADDAIRAFNAMTGHDYAWPDFAEYDGYRSLEEFALEAARPAWPRVPDITRDELIEVTRRILDGPLDRDHDYYLLILETNIAHPGIAGLFNDASLKTAEAIIDEALRYRPIAL